MKKSICLIIIVVTGFSSVFAKDFSLSTGAGGLIGGFWSNYTITGRNNLTATQQMSQFNYGFYAFFDATYAVFSITGQNGINNFEERYTGSGMPLGNGWDRNIGLNLLGKFPFKLHNNKFIVSPLLGVEYQISIRQEREAPDGSTYSRTEGKLGDRDKNGNRYNLSDWNSFWINMGGGVDYYFAQKFFLRGEFLYNFRFKTSYERKNIEVMKIFFTDNNLNHRGLTNGPTLRISIGHRFM